jgi:signal peptidase I
MKKYQIVLVSIAGLIGLLWIVGRSTNAFQYYTVSSGSNEPTLKKGTHFFTSNLITPKRFDFITFAINTPEFGKQIWVHRICGMPGDTVEIRNGDLFVNNTAMDEKMNLKKLFAIPYSQVESVQVDEMEMIPMGTDSVMVPLETLKQEAIIKKARRCSLLGDEYPEIEKRYRHKWTAHRFGPYVVPAGKYFVMGDNRYFSNDSRYHGPIDNRDVLGTVIR